MSARRRGGLGRDLDALLGTGDTPAGDAGSALATIAIDRIQPGRFQPRHAFDDGRLDELAASIKAQGIIQPIVVRAISHDRYELIAGERRWRAARKAGLAEIPAVVRAVPDKDLVAMALIENIQREDLTPIEEAQALARLLEEFRLTHQAIADAIGRSRAAVTNLLRLLDLPADVRAMIDAHELDMGHARALAALPPPRASALAARARDEGWSVRQLETVVRGEGGKGAGKRAARRKIDPDIADLERSLGESLGTRVEVRHGRGGRGRLVIHYHDLDALDGILERLR